MRAFTDLILALFAFLAQWWLFDNMHQAEGLGGKSAAVRPYFWGKQEQLYSISISACSRSHEIEEKQAVLIGSLGGLQRRDYEPKAFFQNFFNNDQLTAFPENQSGI